MNSSANSRNLNDADLTRLIARVARSFTVPGIFLDAALFGSGHINDTFAARFNQAGTTVRYIFQRINSSVFKRPEEVMENIARVTEHQRAKLRGHGDESWLLRHVPTLIPALDGGLLHRDDKGQYWRAFYLIEGARSHDMIENTQQAAEAARAFGEFQHRLVDMPGERLHETIPDFHNTRARFRALQKAIENDSHNRAAEAEIEIAFAQARAGITGVVIDLLSRGELPERVIHNDTKLNNVLMDESTGEALCVIDLDTVMPGPAVYDFGDMVRTATSPSAEDERDLSKVTMQMTMFEALARGYLSAAGTFLTKKERDLLAFSGKLITFETGLRFLTDYLEGDVYFKVHRDGHNLDRCRTQFKLVESIELQEEKMRARIESLSKL